MYVMVALPRASLSLLPSVPTDGQLVEATRAGKPWAREALFKRHFATATRIAWRIAPGGDAEDVAQDALVEALLNIKKLTVPAAFVGWLRGIVVRIVSQRLRRRRMLHRLGFVDSPDDIAMNEVGSHEAPPEVRIELSQVYSVLYTLTVQQRVAFTLSRVEGLTNEELAEALGVSVATAKRRLAEAVETVARLENP
jgi:RNA polymerase sigma-70 factor, ECF subfamily